MVNGPRETTKVCNFRRPGLSVVCQWIISAWESLPRDMVIRSFLKCGILNSMDSTEDDALFHNLIERPSSLVPRDADTTDDCEFDDSFVYDAALTKKDIEDLFLSDSDEEFEGF